MYCIVFISNKQNINEKMNIKNLSINQPIKILPLLRFSYKPAYYYSTNQPTSFCEAWWNCHLEVMMEGFLLVLMKYWESVMEGWWGGRWMGRWWMLGLIVGGGWWLWWLGCSNNCYHNLPHFCFYFDYSSCQSTTSRPRTISISLSMAPRHPK